MVRVRTVSKCRRFQPTSCTSISAWSILECHLKGSRGNCYYASCWNL